MPVNVFAVPVFFIVFRETLEVVIIVAVLLAFLKQTLDNPDQDVAIHKRLVRQVWMGVVVGLLITMIIAGAFIGIFYTLGRNHWAPTELYWEGSFALVASIIITLMGAALLRLSKMQEKWRVKIGKAMQAKAKTSGNNRGAFKRWSQKYAMFVLPLVTVLREGIEAVVFIAGVSFSAPATSVPLPVVTGIIAGCFVGYIIYTSGTSAKLQYFLIVSTCLLYLVAAGLFSKAVWYIEAQMWNIEVGHDVEEIGVGPGSYDITKSVWHVNYGSPYIDGGGGWGIFNAILGWQNSATYGSVISYNVYWIAVITMFSTMRFYEVNGRWPIMKAKDADTKTERGGFIQNGDPSGSSGLNTLNSDTGAKVEADIQEMQIRAVSITDS